MSTGGRADAALHEARTQDGTCYLPQSEAERKHLDRRVRNSEVTKTMRGAYAETAWWQGLTPLEQTVCLARTYAKKHAHWVYCGATAAALWGFSPAYALVRRLHIAVPAGAKYRNTDLVTCHRMERIDCRNLDGVLVTSPEQTAVDCIRSFPLADGLSIADAATRRCRWDNLHILDLVGERPEARLRGVGRARIVALLTDSLSESGGESVARANIIRGGFQLPELQVEVPGLLDKSQGHRVDFAWPTEDGSLPLYGELDWRIKYTDPEMTGGDDALDVLLRERRRESELTIPSRAIVRLSYAEARSLATITEKLGAFGAPRVQQQLNLNGDARHDLANVVDYLELNAGKNSTVEERLAYVEAHRAELCLQPR